MEEYKNPELPISNKHNGLNNIVYTEKNDIVTSMTEW